MSKKDIVALYIIFSSLILIKLYIENNSLKEDIKFMEWQSKEFSKLLDENNIFHAWG